MNIDKLNIEGLSVKNMTDYFNELDDYWKNGGAGGLSVGFDTFKNRYTWGEGTCTDWTGFPTSGKTQMLLEVALNVSIKYDVKHLLYMPDLGSEVEIIADLIHKYTGKTFDKRYPNYISQKEIMEVQHWIDEHFFILTQNDLNRRITPLDVWNTGIELKDKLGVTSVLIDSWKDLFHDSRDFGRDDIYLAYILSKRNRLAERHKMHFHTIVHPTKPRRDADGGVAKLTAYDLKGGSEWFNNAKNLIVVTRPDKDDNLTEIDIRKIKPRNLGKVGTYYLNFDVAKFRYYEKINGKKMFAWDFENEKQKKDYNPDKYIEKTINNKNDVLDELPF